MTLLCMVTILFFMTSSTMQHCLHDVIHSDYEDDYDVTQDDDDVIRKRRQVSDDDDETDDVIKLGDFYKKMRLKLWFDVENIDLNSEERKRLEEQTVRAAEKLSSFLRGLFCVEKIS